MNLLRTRLKSVSFLYSTFVKSTPVMICTIMTKCCNEGDTDACFVLIQPITLQSLQVSGILKHNSGWGTDAAVSLSVIWSLKLSMVK